MTGTALPLPSSVADLFTPLQKEVIDAYLRYWDIRGKAYYALDTSRLHEVMASAELEREIQGVEELKGQGRGAKLDIGHDFRIVSATPERAVVYDDYVNRSVFIDATTKREIPTKDPPEVLKITFEMERVAGTWKVVDGAVRD